MVSVEPSATEAILPIWDGKTRGEWVNKMFADPEVNGIFCIRGGDGGSHRNIKVLKDFFQTLIDIIGWAFFIDNFRKLSQNNPRTVCQLSGIL